MMGGLHRHFGETMPAYFFRVFSPATHWVCAPLGFSSWLGLLASSIMDSLSKQGLAGDGLSGSARADALLPMATPTASCGHCTF